MATGFTSSKGKTFFLKSRQTKKGNTTYYLTKTADKDCLDKVPEGYEVFEHYEMGMLYVRKIKPRKFSDIEIKTIERELKKNESLADYKLDIDGDKIRIYVVEQAEFDSLSGIFEKYSHGLAKMEQLTGSLKHFNEKMRISVVEGKNYRGFQVERFCYRGSVDDWIQVGSGEILEPLAKTYLVHLGKESYFDLMWG